MQPRSTRPLRSRTLPESNFANNVYAGFIDTGPKMAPAQVAARAIDGVESGLNHVLVDERARQIYDAVRRDPEQLERTQQDAWDQ